jgi:pyruvate dehydrogenase E2 component (dihydrolipoamide acetyltransferase)
MATELRMPALSPTMEEGTLAKWLVSVGDAVRPGDLLAEIETDKATMEYEAVDEGRLLEILIAEGTDGVKVGTVIARLTDIDAVVPEDVEVPIAVPEVIKPASDPFPAILPMPTPRHDPLEVTLALADSRTSPLARRIAGYSGIDLSSIVGTGPGGRIVKADLGLSPAIVRQLDEARDTAVPPPVLDRPEGVPFETIRLSGMRKTIARRLTTAKQTVPHFYLSIDCKIDALLALRAELNAALATQRIRLSINDFLIKALARALGDVPEANVQFAGEEMYRFERVDVSMAVAVEGGLVTPVITDAGTKRLSIISAEAQALAIEARDGKLAPEQYRGGTVSISNLGMFGIERIFPVINPPQAMILGIGVGEQRVCAVDGHAAVATMLTATASFDHRAIDGAISARTMAALRSYIEHPLRLVA